MAKILIVEDESNVATAVQDQLELEHHRVELANNGQDALACLAGNTYDLIILDLYIPGPSGLEICQSFRANGGTTPVLMLTGADSLADKLSGFTVGTDDYLTKPFQLLELSLRVQALLRRSQKVFGVLSYRGLEMDPAKHSVLRDGIPVHLAPLEYSLLEFFLRNQGQVFSWEEIFARVWPSDSEKSSEIVRSCVRKLRAKLDLPGPPSLIENIHGVGYRLN